MTKQALNLLPTIFKKANQKMLNDNQNILWTVQKQTGLRFFWEKMDTNIEIKPAFVKILCYEFVHLIITNLLFQQKLLNHGNI